MAGHSKWKNIKARKGAQDAKRGKIFTKIAMEVTVAVRLAGADPDSNARLRAALIKARDSNMPKDNIERAIKKGLGDTDGAAYAEKTYEGYGPGGVAFVVECLTDNLNRTVSDVRHAFTKFGGNLGTEGSVSWMFHKKGMMVFDRSKISHFDKLMEVALEHGAEDIKEEEDSYEILCQPADFLSLKDALEAAELVPDHAEVTRIPENYSSVSEDQAITIHKMVDWLEDNDDVQNVYHSAEMPDES